MKYIRIDIPVGNYYYVPAFFWKKKKDFRKAIGCDKHTDACFMHLTLANKHYPLLGELHFVKGQFGAGIIAHEITHVAVCMINRMNVSDNEEFLCETVQLLTNTLLHNIAADKKLRKFLYE